MTTKARPRVLIVGGGYVGMYTALELQKILSRREAEIVVVDPQPHMTYQPFLPEAAAGSISPRHVVAPLRKVLRKCTIITGSVVSVDHHRKMAVVRTAADEVRELAYDQVVLAAGSVARTLPIPGLAENAVGFRTVGEAIFLRNHVLAQLDAAATAQDEDTRRRALTFVFVGGGFAGCEALAELEDMARDAMKFYPELDASQMRWVLVEAAQRILPEVGPEMGAYSVQRLLDRKMDLRLNTRLESCVDGRVKLSDGDEFDANTIVWTAGVKANPLTERTDLPTDRRRRITTTSTLQVVGTDGTVVDGAWSAGDVAAVPDLSSDDPEATCAPNAQHAVRQARRLGKNIAAMLRGRQPTEYRHSHVGSVASLGLHKGVARLYGVNIKGVVAWFLHRAYHMSRVPTMSRKIQVVADWTLAMFLRRDLASLGELHHPREAFTEVATSTAELEAMAEKKAAASLAADRPSAGAAAPTAGDAPEKVTIGQ